jgi:hypothetical protein
LDSRWDCNPCACSSFFGSPDFYSKDSARTASNSVASVVPGIGHAITAAVGYKYAVASIGRAVSQDHGLWYASAKSAVFFEPPLSFGETVKITMPSAS